RAASRLLEERELVGRDLLRDRVLAQADQGAVSRSFFDLDRLEVLAAAEPDDLEEARHLPRARGQAHRPALEASLARGVEAGFQRRLVGADDALHQAPDLHVDRAAALAAA